jgi:hypothetical protein
MTPQDDDIIEIAKIPVLKTATPSHESDNGSEISEESEEVGESGAEEGLSDDEIDESLPILSEKEKQHQINKIYQTAGQLNAAHCFHLIQGYWHGQMKSLHSKMEHLKKVSLAFSYQDIY